MTPRDSVAPTRRPAPPSTSPTPNVSRHHRRKPCPRCAGQARSPCPPTPRGPTGVWPSTAKDVPYLRTPWLNTYKPVRSHNEGANGRFKSGALDIGNRKHRPAPGQVIQALFLALMLTVANLRILETWLTERDGPDELTAADFDTTGPLPPLSTPAITPPPQGSGRHPPPRSR